MVIYLDILILVNLAVDAVLLWITAKVIRKDPPALRMLSALLLAVAYGTIVCMPEFSVALNIFFRIAAALLISLIAFGFPSFRGFLKNTAAFIVVTCAYTGVLLLLQQIPAFEDSIYVNNGQVYYDLPIPCVLLGIVVICALHLVVSRFLSKKSRISGLAQCTLTLCGKSVDFRCFADTGNFLRDAITGRPVVIVQADVLRKLVDIDSDGGFKYGEDSPMRTRVRLIPYRAADGSEGMLNAFRPDSFVCNGKKLKVLVAANTRRFDTDGSYEGIMPAVGA